MCKVQTQIPVQKVPTVMLVEANQRDGNSYESNRNYNKKVFNWRCNNSLKTYS